jgi:hypothetical protein
VTATLENPEGWAAVEFDENGARFVDDRGAEIDVPPWVMEKANMGDVISCEIEGRALMRWRINGVVIRPPEPLGLG